jgi:nucleoside-diphosphate-sugar epimerase
MNILVTGASGFIGRKLLSVLGTRPAGDAVFAVVRSIQKEVVPNVSWITADLGDVEWTKSLPDKNFDTVIHLAQSKHYRDFPNQVDDIFKINVQATVELADWASRHGVTRFLFASTGNVYGFRNSLNSEEDRCDPETMYGASKLSAEILLKPFSEFMDVVVLRLFGVYGPGQTEAMLPGIIQRFNAGAEITLAGNIGVRFNPIYVDDCVAAIHGLTTANSLAGYEVLNIGGSELIDLRRVSELLESYSGMNAKIRITDDQPKELVGSNEKMHRFCTLAQTTPFQEGFRRTFTWFKDSPKAG